MTHGLQGFDPTAHADHDPRLASLEESLAKGQEPGPDLRDLLARCPDCVRDAEQLQDVVRRIGRAAAVMDLNPDPPARVRERVRAAAMAGQPRNPASPDPKRPTAAWVRAPLLGRLAWTGLGAVIGALAVALVLSFAVPLPAAASFMLTGSDLAPGATGSAALRPLDGGSTAMTLRMHGLPASRPGEFYELWWVGPDKRHISCGTFRSDGSPVDLAFTSGVDISTTVLMEITLERDDGDTTPGPHVAQ